MYRQVNHTCDIHIQANIYEYTYVYIYTQKERDKSMYAYLYMHIHTPSLLNLITFVSVNVTCMYT